MGIIKGLITLLSLIGAAYYVLNGLKVNEESGKFEISELPIAKIVVAVIGFFGVIVLLSTFHVIPAGTRGVVFSQAVGVEKRVLPEGFSMVMPLIESVVPVDVRTDKESATGKAASKDLQDVTLEVLVNYNPDPGKVNEIYQKIGDKEAVQAKIIAPAVQEMVKGVTPKFTAAEIIQKRHEVKEMVFADLSKRLAKSHLFVSDISIVDIQFNKGYMHEIEEKAKQEQIAQREELIVRQKTAKANQAIATAKGQKESAILRAQGTSEANRLLEQSISPGVLQLRYLEKWNGKLPTYMVGGDGAGALIQLPPAGR